MFTSLTPKGASKPIAPYVHGVRVGDTIHVSGTLAIDESGNTVFPDDIRAQTRYVIESVVAVVEAAGGTIDNIFYNQIFLKRREDYAAFNEVYAEFFGKNPPARYCVVCELVRDDFLVELATTANVPDGAS